MEKLHTARVLIGKLSFIALVIALSGVCDGLSSAMRVPLNQLDMIAGRTTEIIGKFYGNTANPGNLAYVSGSPGLSVSFEKEGFKGFWLGENMWRGTIVTSKDLTSGTYSLKITSGDMSNIKPKHRKDVENRMTYPVRVFRNEAEMRAGELSMARRFLGISPWILSALSLPLILVSGALVFLLSGKIEKAMAENGQAEIYRVSKNDSQLEVFFGLGETHGLTQGEAMKLFDKSGRLITEIRVHTIGPENSSALTDLCFPVTPGFLVARG